MKLSYFPRETGKKGETHRLRREKKIPGILYGNQGPALPLFLKKEEFDARLRVIRPGLLATTFFELQEEGGESQRVLIKEIQYHRTTYAVEHIDFMRITEQTPVTVNVPIHLLGEGECAGVKLGGFIRYVMRQLKVSCLPSHLPQELFLDVRDMQIDQSKRLSDIAIPEGVRPLAKMGGVVVVIAKKV